MGWALGDRQEHHGDVNWDHTEAERLYNLLEGEITQTFYTRDERKIPVAWVGKIRASMSKLTPHFSTNRVVRQYTEQFYLPAAESYSQRAADGGALAKKIAEWQLSLKQHWDQLQFGEIKVETGPKSHQFEVQVYLNNLDRNGIKVQLYSLNQVKEMDYMGEIPYVHNGHKYRAEVPLEEPPSNYTPRIVPYFPGVATPLESNQILWQR